jgi:hypothetical protein
VKKKDSAGRRKGKNGVFLPTCTSFSVDFGSAPKMKRQFSYSFWKTKTKIGKDHEEGEPRSHAWFEKKNDPAEPMSPYD